MSPIEEKLNELEKEDLINTYLTYKWLEFLFYWCHDTEN